MKPISEHLQQLIDEANTAIEKSQTTIKEKLLSVYEQAKSEGFEPKEARKLMEEKITAVSDRYVRQVLPDEAKNLNMRRLPDSGTVPQIQEQKQIGTVPKLEEKQETQENNVNITTKHEITEVDSIPEPHVTTLEIQKASELQDDTTLLEKDKEIETQKKMILDKNEHIQQLEIKVERLTDQVDAQATKLKEYMKQETTKSIQDDERKNEVTVTCPFTLPEKQLFMQCEKCHTGNTHIISGRVYSKKEWVPYQDNTAEQKQRLEKWGKV